LQINGKRIIVTLKDDKSQAGKLTASGSLATSWSEDVTFELTRDGLKFHPTLIIFTGNGQLIYLETAYKRGSQNPSLIVKVVSPLSEPLKLSCLRQQPASPFGQAEFDLSMVILAEKFPQKIPSK
jgi:hypothetical protein